MPSRKTSSHPRELQRFWWRKILISRITSRTFTSHLAALASTMPWVDNTLNFTNGYYKVTGGEGDQFEYLVPYPPRYTSTMKAYWTTGVIILDSPSFSWQAATKTPLYEDGNGPSSWDVTLPKSNLGLTLNDSFGMFLLSSNVFIYLLDSSISQWQYHEGFNVHTQKQKCYGIWHSCCGRFDTFCHRSTYLPLPSIQFGEYNDCGPILHPDTQITLRKRPCVSPVL